MIDKENQFIICLSDLFLRRMLNYSDTAKLIKPCLALHVCKIVLFGSLSILFIASGQVPFSPMDGSVSQCSPYLNMKLSLYLKGIHLVTFSMTVIGCILSLINFVNFLAFFIKARKKLTYSENKNQKGYSQNRIKFNFTMGFLETICLINVFLRSVQQLRQFQTCNIFSKIVLIVSIIIASLIISVSLVNYCILVKFLLLVRKKIETLEEFSFYSDRTSIRKNLIFNKKGYVNQLRKMQNFSSRSTSLKSETIKGIPSGFKRNDFSPSRQIIYKLCGGNKQQFNQTTNDQHENQRKISYEEQYTLDNELSSSRKKSNDQKKKQTQSQQNNLALLDVKPKFYMPGPNQENLKQATKTIDILQTTLGKKQPPKLQYESSVSEQQPKNNLNSPTQKMNTTQRLKNDQNQKQKQKISKQLRQQEELKLKFNLTPNLEERRKYEKTKNWQNIDQNGHYFQVNLQKIKTKTKFLNFANLKEDNEQINPNVLYSRKQWVQRKKRVAKKHEKNVQQYLRNLSKIRKQEMLCQEDSSDYSQSFQEHDLSSQFDDSSSEYAEQDQNIEKNQKQQKNQTTQKKVENQIKQNNEEQNVQKSVKRKKRPKNTQPQLYLHMRRRKHAPVENKLKLYQDEQGFYDDENDLQSSEGEYKKRDEEEKQIEKIYEKGLGRDQSIQKQRQQEKILYKNKQIETQEADMLRLIRKKYVDARNSKMDRNKNEKKAIIFEQQKQNSQTKQKR